MVAERRAEPGRAARLPPRQPRPAGQGGPPAVPQGPLRARPQAVHRRQRPARPGPRDRQPDNPLTARVMVNRVWLHHFGAGPGRPRRATSASGATRRATPSCSTGWPTTSSRQGWSVKALHRRIVLSSTYRQRERQPPRGRWRKTRRTASTGSSTAAGSNSRRCATPCSPSPGALDPTMGGRSVPINDAPVPAAADGLRLHRPAQNLDGVYRTFDFASPDASSPRRLVDDRPAAGPLPDEQPVRRSSRPGASPAAAELSTGGRPRTASAGSTRRLFGRDARAARARPWASRSSAARPSRGRRCRRRPGRTATRGSTRPPAGRRLPAPCRTGRARPGSSARSCPTPKAAYLQLARRRRPHRPRRRRTPPSSAGSRPATRRRRVDGDARTTRAGTATASAAASSRPRRACSATGSRTTARSPTPGRPRRGQARRDARLRRRLPRRRRLRLLHLGPVDPRGRRRPAEHAGTPRPTSTGRRPPGSRPGKSTPRCCC